MTQITQSEFDQLATFIAVAEELLMEPFMSEDNHERLINSPESENRDQFFAYFCHPAFLKSAVAPFRKLWLLSEPCAYEKIRALVFRLWQNQDELPAHRCFFYDLYSRKLDSPADARFSTESPRSILDTWLYTQAVHAGPKEFEPGKKQKGQIELKEFDRQAELIGREKFEFLFRTSVRTVGSLYIEFLKKLTYPLFHLLTRDFGMVPGFEAAAALKYSPYPNPRYNITFDDVFWHLDKESVEETFDRLLERQHYGILKGFLRGFFRKRPVAFAAVCEHVDFSGLLQASGACILRPGENTAELPTCLQTETLASPLGSVRFEVYEKRKIRFHDDAARIFDSIYEDFRNCLFEERRRQRKKTWQDW